MGKSRKQSTLDLDCAISEFRNRCATYFAGKEGRADCTCRDSHIVRVEKLRGDMFADCVERAQAISSTGADIHLVVDNEGYLLPILFAMVVDTAKARIPYIYRHQQWSLFMKHEKVLLLFASSNIPVLEAGITLTELGKAYEAGGFRQFDRTLPWIGMCIPWENGHYNPGYTVKSAGFDANTSRIVIKVTDSAFELACAY